MKPFIIRKQNACGHYSIFKIEDLLNLDGPDLLRLYNMYGEQFSSYDFVVREVAHLENFGDVLVLLNARSRV